jgi:hypothetical protein
MEKFGNTDLVDNEEMDVMSHDQRLKKHAEKVLTNVLLLDTEAKKNRRG